jgi:hypothetical protein
MPNPRGTPGNLIASHPQNMNPLKHGVRSKHRRALEPRAQEIAEAILEAPHTVDLDEIGAVEIGRLEALIETIDQEIVKRGIVNRGGQVRTLVETRLKGVKL